MKSLTSSSTPLEIADWFSFPHCWTFCFHCRYYYLAFRAHQMPETSKENAAIILERAKLENWVLGTTKVPQVIQSQTSKLEHIYHRWESVCYLSRWLWRQCWSSETLLLLLLTNLCVEKKRNYSLKSRCIFVKLDSQKMSVVLELEPRHWITTRPP